LISYSTIKIANEKGERHLHSKVDLFSKFCFQTGE